jgi:hypothetical protein
MERIPITGILGDTYRFLFSNFGSIFGLTWVSALLLEVSEFVLTQIESSDQTFGVQIVISLAAILIYSLCYSVMAVAVARFAMSSSPEKVVAHFAIGRTEWRMFRSLIVLAISATIIFLLALLSVAIAAMIVSAVSGADFGTRADPDDSLLSRLVVACLLVSLIGGVFFVVVRYWFFLPLAAIFAPDQWLSRSYDLSAGYFWPILGVIVGVSLPFVGFHFVWLAIEALDAWRSGTLDVPASFDQLSEILRGAEASERGSQLSWRTALEPLMSFIATVSTVGLDVSAAVLIYRLLTERRDNPGNYTTPKPGLMNQ